MEYFECDCGCKTFTKIIKADLIKADLITEIEFEYENNKVVSEKETLVDFDLICNKTIHSQYLVCKKCGTVLTETMFPTEIG